MSEIIQTVLIVLISLAPPYFFIWVIIKYYRERIAILEEKISIQSNLIESNMRAFNTISVILDERKVNKRIRPEVTC